MSTEKTFYVFASKPTFDPTEGETAEDYSALIGYERSFAARVAAEREPPEEYDREDTIWILTEGAHPDESEEWTRVWHSPQLEVRRRA